MTSATSSSGWTVGERALFAVFLIWASVGIVLAWAGVSLPPSFRWTDGLFIVLAAANLGAYALRDAGPRRAGLAFAWVAAGSAAIETIGATTGWPFGSYHYTDQFGARIAGVLPWTIPLAWWCVLASGHGVVRGFGGRSRWSQAALVACWATMLDVLLEPFAWRIKEYWIWHGTEVPLSNYAAWWITSFVLVALWPWHGPVRADHDMRPSAVGVALALTFLAAWIR